MFIFFFQLEHQSILDYIGKAEHIAALHGQITTCDEILEVWNTSSALSSYILRTVFILVTFE